MIGPNGIGSCHQASQFDLRIAAKEKIFSEYISILISLQKELEYCIFIYIYCALYIWNHMSCLKEGSANFLDCHDHIHETPTEDGLSCFYWTTHRWII